MTGRERLRRPMARQASGRTDWYRIQAKAENRSAELYIYDEIGYYGDSAKSLTKDLYEVDADTITVHVNSPGGDIFDGLAIYQALKDHKAQVMVKIDGLAASIASVIAMAGDRIIMAPKASMMIHDGWTIEIGNAADLRKTADLLDKQSEIIASVYADRSGQPTDFWRSRMLDETWYNAQEALDAGLVDEIEGQEKETDGFDLSVFAYAGREKAPAPVIKVEFDSTAVADQVVDAAESLVSKPEPVVETNPEPETPKAEFVWNFSAFRDALEEGIHG